MIIITVTSFEDFTLPGETSHLGHKGSGKNRTVLLDWPADFCTAWPKQHSLLRAGGVGGAGAVITGQHAGGCWAAKEGA